MKGREAIRGSRDLEFAAASGWPVVVAIPVNNGPISGIAVSPDGSRLMVTNYGRDSASVIDTDTCRVTETVAGVNEPFAIAMASVGANRAYVSTVATAYDSIAVIDMSTNTVIATYPLALSVSDLVVSPDGKYVYASRNGVSGADVAILDTTTDQVEVIGIADVADFSGAPGTTTECVRISPDGARLYVGTNGPGGGRLVVIGPCAQSDDDASPSGGRMRWRRKNSGRTQGTGEQTGLRVLDTIETGWPIGDVALSPHGAIAYVASCGPESDAVIDVIDTRTSKIVGTRKISEIGGVLTGLTFSGDGHRAYLVTGDGITVLCTLTHDVIGTITVARQPSCVVESPDGNYLYIADYSGTVTVAPVASVTASGIESAARESDASAECTMPELLQYEAALA